MLIPIFLATSILLESSVTTLPLTLLVLLFAGVATRSNNIFGLAFLSGLALDFLSFRTIGISSIYFVSFVFAIFLYQKKFEIETLHFIAVFSFLGCLGYLFLTGSGPILTQTFFITLINVLSFFIYKLLNKPALKKI